MAASKQDEKTQKILVGRRTAREVLEKEGGVKHARHTVMLRSRVLVQLTPDNEIVKRVRLTCSCGDKVTIDATEEHERAIENVRMEPQK